jgi:competence protein ComEC
MIFDFILNPLITLLVNISDFLVNLQHSAIQTSHPNPAQIVLYYMILINTTLFLNKDFRSKYLKYMSITLPVFIFILLVSTISLPNKNLEITAFDVGNADAFMIKTPDNKYLMIDTGKAGYNNGKSQAEILINKYFTDHGINNLDSLIVTHFDNDHCGGTVDLLNKMKVKTLYVNSLNHDSPQAQEIYKTAGQRNTDIMHAKNNQTVYNNKLKITNYIIKDGKDNESSIITLITYGDFSMLFTGDAGVETFNKLKQNLPPNITVLKVPHHGASGVINKSMADYLNPKYSIISTGENKFGHPSVYTTEILKNSTVLRTDIHNSVRIVVTPKEYKVLTYNPKKKKYTN